LQIKRLESCNTELQIKDALNTIPKNLEDTYRETLERIPSKDSAIARSILIWLVSSLQPLTLNELAAAVSLPRPEFALRICTSMLVTFIHEDTDKIVKLAHFSVKEYLVLKEPAVENDNGASWYRFSNELAHATLAERTTEYLLNTNDVDIDVYRKTIISKPLLRYSAKYWYQHARAIGDDIAGFPQLREQINKIFSSEYSKSYLNWLRIRDCDDVNIFLPKKKTFPQPLYHASLLGLQESVEKLLDNGANATAKGGNLSNALIAASVHGHSKIVARLVVNYDKVEMSFIERTVRNIKRNIRETMEVLLNAEVIDSNFGKSKAERIEITEKVVKAAAGNTGNGKEVMELLLDRRGAEVQITEAVVKAAAGNTGNGKVVMELLLDRRGAEVQITEEVVKAAAGNEWNGKEVMKLLLDRRGAEVRITREVVKAAAGNQWNGKEVIALLLNQRGAEVYITKEVVKAAAGNIGNGKEVMGLLLDRRGAEVQITEAVVKAATGNTGNGKEVMSLLFDQREAEVQITEEVVKAAAWNWRGKEVMTLLLDQRGAEVQITEEVVKAAAANRNGRGVMTLLLDQRGAEVQITEEVVKAAAGNWRGKEVMTLLLDRRGAKVQITEEVVKAAAMNKVNGKEIMTLLLDRRGAEAYITKEVVKAAAMNERNGREVIELLLNRRGAEVQITEEVAKAAAANSNGEIMALLLDRRGTEVQITREVDKASMTSNTKRS
jgi:hypothetical protein